MKLILIIDDEKALADAIADRLAAEGYRCAISGDGVSGLSKLREGRSDLAILDVMLPGKNGFEVLRAYRQDGGTIPILMLTAKASAADTVSGLRLGADDYLAKPFDMDVLTARVENLLRRTGSQAESNTAPAVDLDAPDFKFGPFTVVFRRAELLKAGESLPLSYREYTLLADRNRREICGGRYGGILRASSESAGGAD